MAIPSRFDLSMTPAGRFLQLQQPQTPRPQSQVIARDALGRISAAGAPLLSAGPQATPRTPFGFRKDVMDRLTGIQPTMGAAPPPPPKKPMSFMDRISPELGTPASAGLGAAAATGLQMSGYSPTPISTAQGLGAMMQSGMQAYTAEKKAQAAAELAKQQRDTDIRLKMMEINATRTNVADAKTDKALGREIDMARQLRVDSKPFAGVKTNYRKLASAATTKNPTGPTDIGLIFSYMKMLDPTSVVRGSEYEAAANASPYLEMLGNLYNQARKGVKLPEKTRQKFYQAATEYYMGEVEGQAELEAQATQQATNFGLRPDKVVVSALPTKGSQDFPHVIYDISEVDSLPAGDTFMIQGIVYTKDAN